MRNPWAATQTPSVTHSLWGQQLWIWPLVAAVALAALAIWLRQSVEGKLRAGLVNQLQAVLDAEIAALDLWYQSEEATANGVARDDDCKAVVQELLAAAQAPQPDELRARLANPLRKARQEMQPLLETHGYQDFLIIDRQGLILASSRDELTGLESPPEYRPFLDVVGHGRSLVTRPFASAIRLPDSDGVLRAGVPTMFVGAPVRDEAGEIVAVLALRIQPETNFTRILSVARMGDSGETYACDAEGTLLSESRFDVQLKALGLLPDRPGARSILELSNHNPQVDLTRFQRPPLTRSKQPLTVAAAAIARGESGYDVAGYRDYRGVPTIGAWKWLPERGFAVVTEIDIAEAQAPLRAVRWAVWGLLGLLVLASIAIFIYTMIVARLQRTARQAALELKRLGQYVLEQKIGAGGMGEVYRAHHAMLRRPTAVKLIDPDRTTPAAVARFEREVQLTSQLNHPNTIAIYDYGRTPEGVFYYAMELLDGLNLQTLVDQYGAQPDGRVASILKQVCGSLIEAHAAGLIHRDIKPANIMLCQRGGIFDFVKLLDFGLVKSIAGGEGGSTTAEGLAGTPLYMPPESLVNPQTVDARSDLYALGAVGYMLLTGTTVFSGSNVMEICRHHVDTAVEPIHARVSRPISTELEVIIMACLAKAQQDRPRDARELLHRLEACPVAVPWSQEDAVAWWRQRQTIALAVTEAPTASGVEDATVDLDGQVSTNH